MESKQSDEILFLIARNLAGVSDSGDNAQLKEWIQASAANKQYFEQVRNIWDASDKHIDPKIISSGEALKKVLGKISSVAPKPTLWHYWQKVAAVIVLPLAIGTLFWIYYNSQQGASSNEPVYNEVYAALGTRSALKLSDSTLVWLNSGSSLRYPDKFNNKSRQVYLKGEAYFEVKSDVSKPFIVKTQTLEVKATGTKFNVLEYESRPVAEVTLVSGKIFVSESINKGSHLITELNPDQHLTYNRETGIKNTIDAAAYKYIAWKDGKLIFRNESLSEVVNKIAQIFNVDIELRGDEFQDYRYRATFEDESLEEILKLLKLSSPIDFLEVKRTPLPDGSFPKRKVIIFPAKISIQN